MLARQHPKRRTTDLNTVQTAPLQSSDLASVSEAMDNRYIIAATSDNTRKAYQADIRHYENWGGSLPASTDDVLKYLSAFAETLNPNTLARRLIALKADFWKCLEKE